MSRSFVVGKRNSRVVFGSPPDGFAVADRFCAEAVVNEQTTIVIERKKKRQGIFIKCGFAFAHASALCFVSKNRSMTIAFRSPGVRPNDRAALRLTTSGPVSVAIHSPSPKVTLLP